MTTDEFNKWRDLSKFDMWFSSPEYKRWDAASEVLHRRIFANMHTAGDPVESSKSKTGDPGFDAFINKLSKKDAG